MDRRDFLKYSLGLLYSLGSGMGYATESTPSVPSDYQRIVLPDRIDATKFGNTHIPSYSEWVQAYEIFDKYVKTNDIGEDAKRSLERRLQTTEFRKKIKNLREDPVKAKFSFDQKGIYLIDQLRREYNISRCEGYEFNLNEHFEKLFGRKLEENKPLYTDLNIMIFLDREYKKIYDEKNKREEK